jgi:hypothetical protein
MLRLHFLMLAFLPLLLVLSGTAHAKNVPGSAAAVQGRVDRQVASRIIDITIAAAVDSARFSQCEQQRTDDDSGRRIACEWGFSANGEMLYLKDNPSGYRYESTNGLGTINISRWISPNTVLIGGILFEFGDTETFYNKGDLKRQGVGGSLGIIHHITPEMAFNLFGGVEWLSYDVSRSNGAFEGEYDATRLFADASLSGESGSDTLWLIWRGGLRAVNQDNGSYNEKSGGVTVGRVSGVDLFLLSAVADFKFGTTVDNLRPFIQFTGVADLVHDESLGLLGSDIDDQLLTARIGIGVDADVLEGLLSASSGIYFGEDGYTGFDIRLIYSKNF